MQFLKLVGLAAGLMASADALTLQTKPRIAPRARAHKEYLSAHSAAQIDSTATTATSFPPFSLNGIVTRSSVDANNTAVYDDSISFTFVDPNSGTQTVCNDDFQGTASSTTFPTGYVPCNNNGNLMDDFYWQFISYTSLTSFSIQMFHAFVNSTSNQATILKSDPVVLLLTCADVNHVDGCYSNQTISVPVASQSS